MWKDEIKKREDLFLQGRNLQGLRDNKELLNSAKVLISRVTILWTGPQRKTCVKI